MQKRVVSSWIVLTIFLTALALALDLHNLPEKPVVYASLDKAKEFLNGQCFGRSEEIYISGERFGEYTDPSSGLINLVQELRFIASSHLCIRKTENRDPHVSCLRAENGNVRYCDSDEISNLADYIYRAYSSDVAEMPWLTHPLDRNKWKEYNSNIKNKWKTSNVAPFQDEKDINSKDENGVINTALKKIADDFSKPELENRNVLKVTDVGKIALDYQTIDNIAMLIPCSPNNYFGGYIPQIIPQNIITSCTTNEDCAVGFFCSKDSKCIQGSEVQVDLRMENIILEVRNSETGSIENAFICLNTQSDEYKWVPLTTEEINSYDKDGDLIPEPFDCPPKDKDVFGNFFRYNKDLPPRIICGDNKANTCGIVDETDDSCDSNQYACTHNCLSAESSCDYQAGKCCGGNGIADVGRLDISGTGSNVQANGRVCMNAKLNNVECPVQEESTETKPWCWKPASGDQGTIFTITKPGKETSDYVSNGQSWQSCNSQTQSLSAANTLEVSSTLASQFQCSKQGRVHAWVKCTDLEDTSDQSQRAIADGAYTLHGDQEGNAWVFNANTEDGYKKHYGYLPDFTDYNQLEFVLRFPSTKEDGTPAPQLDLSTRIILSVETEEQGIVFSENVLADAQKHPVLQQDTYVHINTTIQPWTKVKIVKIEAQNARGEPSDVYFKVNHVQVTTESGSNRICANQKWIDNLDSLDAQKACTYFGGKWGGNNVQGEQLCCGNTKNEFWSNPTEKIACWNSIPLGDKGTIGDVQFSVAYQKDTTIYSYPNADIVTDLVLGMKEGKNCPTGFSPIGQSKSCTKSNLQIDGLSFPNSPKAFIEPLMLSVNDINSVNLQLIFPRDDDSARTYFQVYDKEYTPQNNIESGVNEFQTFSVEESGLEGYIIIIPLAEYNAVESTDHSGIEQTPFTFNCNQTICVYPLPGEPPYTIDNVQKQKYNLYYVYKTDDFQQGRKVLIDKARTFYGKNGWLQAEEVPQQVIFSESLYGCGDYNRHGVQAQNTCQIKSDFFCNPSYSWKKENMLNYEYNQQEEPPVLRRAIDESEIQSKDRTQAASIVPGRNLLYNPELEE